MSLARLNSVPEMPAPSLAPSCAYPPPLRLEAPLADCGRKVPCELLLFWLQLRSADAGADKSTLAAAMEPLIFSLEARTAQRTAGAPDATCRLSTADWALDIAPVEPYSETIALLRAGQLLALLQPTPEGGLRVATYYPLDASSLALLAQLGAHPHPRFGVSMCENNWIYSLDKAAGMDNFHACQRGESYLAHWPGGLAGADSPLAKAVSPAATRVQLEVFEQHERRYPA